MTFLLVLFLIPDFVKAEAVDYNIDLQEDKLEKISSKQSSKIFLLKEIPRTKISDEEKNSLSIRNPFLPFGRNNKEGESGIKFSEIDFKGIANIGGKKVAFIQTSNGTNPYEIGEIIGAGFKLLNIDEKNLTIVISNNTNTHSIGLEDDEK